MGAYLGLMRWGDGCLEEVSGEGYQRLDISKQRFTPAAEDGKVVFTNLANLDFHVPRTCREGWGKVEFLGIFEHEAGGLPVKATHLTSTSHLFGGDVLRFEPGRLQLELLCPTTT